MVGLLFCHFLTSRSNGSKKRIKSLYDEPVLNMKKNIDTVLSKHRIPHLEAERRVKYITALEPKYKQILDAYSSWDAEDVDLVILDKIISLSFGIEVDGEQYPACGSSAALLYDIALFKTEYGYIPILKYINCTMGELVIAIEEQSVPPGISLCATVKQALIHAFGIKLSPFLSTMDIHRLATEMAELQKTKKWFCFSNVTSVSDWPTPEEIREWFVGCLEKIPYELSDCSNDFCLVYKLNLISESKRVLNKEDMKTLYASHTADERGQLMLNLRTRKNSFPIKK